MGTNNFVFVVLNVVSAIVDITQSLVQSNSRWILQLINGISKDTQKLFKYFSGATVFIFLSILLLLTAAGSPIKLDLYLKHVESLSGFPAFVRGDSFLLNCYELP